MTDNSDYEKDKRTNLLNFLPEVYQSDTNRSVFENLFNRFLTKDNTERVTGYIGEGNPNAKIKRKIREKTPHRNAFQLQPILYNKIGTIEHMNSWEDILNEFERHGIDTSKFKEWGNTLKFNWIPPIDLDKFINYFNYFWIDPLAPSSQPQYITVKNKCTIATAKFNFFQALVTQHGDTFNIIAVVPANKKIIISGEFAQLFQPGFSFSIVNSTNVDLNNSFQIVESSTFNAILDQTEIILETPFISSVADGQISLQEQLSALQAGRDCFCTGQLGWDVAPWDDNPWDAETGCSLSTITGIEQWIVQNKWVHKNDVMNFSNARAAILPILEFEADLELNEWILIKNRWKYRKTKLESFVDIDAEPFVIELTSIMSPDFTLVGPNAFASNGEIILHEKFGNLTGFFKPDTTFLSNVPGIFQVVKSRYFATAPGSPLQTRIEMTTLALAFLGTEIHPHLTSQGDPWKSYHEHWFLVGQDLATAINHQPDNPFVLISTSQLPTLHGSGNYTFRKSQYAQDFITQVDGITTLNLETIPLVAGTRALTERARFNSDDIRVYVNDIRSYGTYQELDNDVNEFVDGIVFFTPLNKFDTIRIEVGEAALSDIGLYSVPARTIEDEIQFNLQGPVVLSLIRYKKAEQVKIQINQYPLFDIYDVDYTSALQANPIFSYKEDQDAPVFAPVQRRIVRDAATKDFTFEQFLITQDNGKLFAYRNYLKQEHTFWFNPATIELKFWTGFTWTSTIIVSNQLTTPIISDVQPGSPENTIEGFYWFDLVTDTLKVRNTATSTWDPVDPNQVFIGDYDETIETIWRKGLNDEEYIPKYVDENKRQDGDTFIDANNNVQTVVLPIGSELGQWEIPDPLYFNHLHENRKEITYRGALTHFKTIVEAQTRIPAFLGPIADIFHLFQTNEVNFGLGGKIKEFKDGFDTLLSAAFVNNITPPGLFEFAHDQYENQLTQIREFFIANAETFMSDMTEASILDLSNFLAVRIIELYEENDLTSLIYGDSTTFNDITDLGVRNWIATLPYLKLVQKCLPEFVIDNKLNVKQVIHHDGHRNEYRMALSVVEGIIKDLVKIPDRRTLNPQGIADENVGKISTLLPPDNLSEFLTDFGPEFRTGVYWYFQPAPTQNRRLYRFNVISVGDTTPALSHPDGTLWFDSTTGLETLRIKNGVNWNIVSGLFAGDQRFHNGPNPSDLNTAEISAWQVIDVEALLSKVILEVETRLFENAPTVEDVVFDFSTLTDTSGETATFNQYSQEAFSEFTRQREIRIPLSAQTPLFPFNITNPFTWNYKYSTPGAQFDIIDVNTLTDSFTVEGDKTLIFFLGNTFFIKNSIGNSGSYLVASSTYAGGPDETTIVVTTQISSGVPDGIIYFGQLPSADNTGAESGGDWRDLYQKLYGTPYPNLEPWKLQNYKDKPDWWDAEYKDTSGARRWIYNHSTTTGMWENIRIGVIPPGQTYPNGVVSITGVPSIDEITINAPILPSYMYFSVNIDDVTVDSFAPDDLFPPFWDHILNGYPIMTTVKSVFFNFSQQIVNPSADYLFGDAGPVEWIWRNSSQFLYDLTTIAYRMQPMKLLNQSFGTEFYNVCGLLVDKRTENVFAHNRTLFHSDVDTDNSILVFNGINQWYVNFNRFAGYDASYSDFRRLWVSWTAPLMYQFSSFIDISSFRLGHRFIDINEFDRAITIKRSPGTQDFFLDLFNVFILNIPPPIVRYNNENEWRFEIDDFAPLARAISYYATHRYQFYVDVSANNLMLFTWEIVAVDTLNNMFTISGNQTEIFVNGREFDITQSTGNDDLWVVDTAVYDSLNDRTIITPVAPILNSTVDGLISARYRTLPFNTGDLLRPSTTLSMPTPLKDDLNYFLIKINPTTFRLAETKNNALANIPIIVTTRGEGDIFIGQLHSTFVALGGQKSNIFWKHYTVDKTFTKIFTPPHQITGIQNFIDIIDGYARFIDDIGFKVNFDSSLKDPATDRIVDWQVEIERFIDFIHGIRDFRLGVGERYEATVDTTTNIWTFTTTKPILNTGAAVKVYASAAFPSPITGEATFYIIRDTNETFRLATTPENAQAAIEIDILPTVGTRKLFITTPNLQRKALPSHEVNPFRNGIWFAQKQGIVSNLITGPFLDARINQLIFDQYGRPIRQDALSIFREDELTQIEVTTGIRNDINIFNDIEAIPYNFLHIGGAHIFIDTFEHVLIFNNYTQGGFVIYDPFLGINSTKFELDFFRQPKDTFTQRPNLGGYYLLGNELKRNIEGQVNDMRLYYDTHVVSETIETTRRARAVLGYEGTQEYLDNLNLGPKSQFLFYRGLIQYKGSIEAVKAFINSKRFVDARVDEYWAYKLAEFGSPKEKECPEMYLIPEDARTNELRLQFVRDDEGDPVAKVDPTFTPILMSDLTRWFDQPDQLHVLNDSGPGMLFTLEPVAVVSITNTTDSVPAAGNVGEGIIQTINDRNYNYITGIIGTVVVTTVNTTARTPAIAFFDVYLNGILQHEGFDYTVTGPNQITFVLPLLVTDFIAFIELVGSTYDYITATAGQTIFSPTNVKTKPRTPAIAFFDVYLNGILQHEGFDYTVTGPNQITLTGVLIVPGDIIAFISTNPLRNNTYNYTTATAGQTILGTIVLTIARTPLVAFFDVYLNGILQHEGFDYTVTDPNEITFILPLIAGDVITIIEFSGSMFYSWNGTAWIAHGSWDKDNLPILRHNFKSDTIEIRVRYHPEGTTYPTRLHVGPPDPNAGPLIIGTHTPPGPFTVIASTPPVPPDPAVFVDPDFLPYIPLIGGIQVFKNGAELFEGIDYIEPLTPTLTADRIEFAKPLIDRDRIEVVYTSGTLFEDLHYARVNSKIVQLLFADFVDVNSIIIIGLNADKESQNPAKVIDKKAGVVISPVQIWNPTREHHYHIANHIIDMRRDTDPAYYTVSVGARVPNNLTPAIESKIADITGVNVALNQFIIKGNFTTTFTVGVLFNVVNSTANDNRYVTISSSYNSVLDQTTITVVQAVLSPIIDGTIGTSLFSFGDNPWNTIEKDIVWYDTTKAEYIPYFDDKVFPDVEDRLLYWGRVADWGQVKLYQWTESDVPPEEWDALAIAQQPDSTIPDEEKITGKVKKTLYKKNSLGGWDLLLDIHDVFDVTIDGTPTLISNIVSANAVTAQFVVAGNFTATFIPGFVFDVIDTNTLNNGSYTTSSSIFAIGFTTITVTTGIAIPTGAAGKIVRHNTYDFTLINNQPKLFPIIAVDITVDTIRLAGNVGAEGLADGMTITVVGSLAPTIDGVYTVEDVTFNDIDNETVLLLTADLLVTPTTLGSVQFFPQLLLFVNERSTVPETIQPITSLVTISNLARADTVRLIDPAPIEPSFIGAQVEAGKFTFATEHTVDPFVDETGNTKNKYYFWVEQKTVKTGNHNVTLLDAERQLENIPVPYMFFQKIVAEDILSKDPRNDRRQEIHIANVLGQTVFVTRYLPTIVHNVFREIIIDDFDIVTDKPNSQFIVIGDFTTTFVPGLQFSVEGSTGNDRIYTTNNSVYTGFIPNTTIITVNEIIFADAASVFPDPFTDGDIRTFPIQALFTVNSDIVTIIDPIPIEETAQIIIDYTHESVNKLFLPLRYIQVIVRGLRGVINDVNRYTLRFTRDYTLRDSLEHGETPLDLKNLHQEWELFRERQINHVRRELWDRITESIIGFKLADNTVVVPAGNRTIYDQLNLTDTRFGLGPDQAFVDGPTALSTILSDLTNPDIQFYPIDIGVFFINHSFDTPENIIIAMNALYNTFSSEHINRIFFSVLHDAFVTKARFAELFKTSMISVHGIRILETQSFSDD
ncbi:MAG: hypothetical protein ACREAU_00190 [Nitrosopumilaceae archaeon]